MAKLVKVLIAGVRSSDAPLASGLAYTYDSGTSNLATYLYSDNTLVTPHSNPATLNSDGVLEAYCADNAVFRLVVKNSTGTTTVIDVDPAEANNSAITSAITVDTTNDDALTAGAGALLSAWMGFVWKGLSNSSTAATAKDLKWLHPGTSAVGRYPYEVMSDLYNVMDFGAAGTGNSDDTAFVQAAIDAAATAGGGRVYFPGGTYRCDSQLTITNQDKVSLFGDGPGSIIKANQTANPMLSITGTSDSIEVAFLQFQGKGTTLTTTALGISVASGIPASMTVPVNIHDCVFSGPSDGTGLNVGVECLGTRGRVAGCYFQRIYGTGSRAIRTNTGSKWRIEGNHVLGVDGAGTRAACGIGNTTASGGNETTITGNYVEGTSGAGIVCYKNARVAVTGNVVYACQGPGVLLTGAADCVVTGNQLDYNQHGVLIDNDDVTTPIGFVVSGNSCSYSTVNGVRVKHTIDNASGIPQKGSIVGNTIYMSTQSGVYLEGCNEVLVANNMISDCATDATYAAIDVMTALPAATHRGGFANAIIGNYVGDTASYTWSMCLRVRRNGGGGADNVSSTFISGNRLNLPVGGSIIYQYGVSTASPILHGNMTLNATASVGSEASAGYGMTTAYYDMTGSETVSKFYSHGVISNRGAAGAVTATLPQLAAVDKSDSLVFTFIRYAAQNFVIAADAADALYLTNGATAASVTLSAGTDQIIRVFSMGQRWYVHATDTT